MTAAVFLLAVAAGFLLLATSFFGGEGKFEALLKACLLYTSGTLSSYEYL